MNSARIALYIRAYEKGVLDFSTAMGAIECILKWGNITKNIL
jgi:hypothetical protein